MPARSTRTLPHRPAAATHFDVTVHEADSVATVAAHGELDLATAPALGDVLAGRRGSIVVDLRGLEFIDVRGAHALLDADAEARSGGTDLRLLLGPVAERLLRILELRDRFRVREPLV
jgi:anti-anti-sigma factor